MFPFASSCFWPSIFDPVRLLQVQEAADCLGADCVPRYVEMKNLLELEIDDAFQAKQKV